MIITQYIYLEVPYLDPKDNYYRLYTTLPYNIDDEELSLVRMFIVKYNIKRNSSDWLHKRPSSVISDLWRTNAAWKGSPERELIDDVKYFIKKKAKNLDVFKGKELHYEARLYVPLMKMLMIAVEQYDSSN